MKCRTLLMTLALINSTRCYQPRKSANQSMADEFWRPEQPSHHQSKFKNKVITGWYEKPTTESGTRNSRQLEWFDGSDNDQESAEDPGFLNEIFGSNDKKKSKKDKINIDDDLRQHRRRKYVRVHRVLLPLLIAYKLKFFTMIPILLGALVLLVYTTGLSGFFFALFAAATGLHVKTGRH